MAVTLELVTPTVELDANLDTTSFYVQYKDSNGLYPFGWSENNFHADYPTVTIESGGNLLTANLKMYPKSFYYRGIPPDFIVGEKFFSKQRVLYKSNRYFIKFIGKNTAEEVAPDIKVKCALIPSINNPNLNLPTSFLCSGNIGFESAVVNPNSGNVNTEFTFEVGVLFYGRVVKTGSVKVRVNSGEVVNAYYVGDEINSQGKVLNIYRTQPQKFGVGEKLAIIEAYDVYHKKFYSRYNWGQFTVS